MLVTYPRLGHSLRVATPPQPAYQAPGPVWDRVKELKCDEKICWGTDPREAVQGADVVVTDTWYSNFKIIHLVADSTRNPTWDRISMGQEAEYEQRVRDFAGYQVTEALCREGGANPGWKFLHCLPRKEHEVDDEARTFLSLPASSIASHLCHR
jgi:ornithine carbamoyltransferase